MRYSLVIFSLLFLLSCNEDPTKVKGSSPIDKETFTQILAEIHIVDAITNQPRYFNSFKKNDSIDLFSPVFEKYGVTQAEFDSTVSYFTKKPGEYLEIYDNVIQNLNYRKDTLENNQPVFKKEN